MGCDYGVLAVALAGEWDDMLWRDGIFVDCPGPDTAI